MLVSPSFLYRSVANPDANDPSVSYQLDGYELANRLSYFLWSSMPDEALLEAARAGIEMDLQAGLTLEKTLFSLLMSTTDRAEAALAFKEKRPPRFTGT